LSASFADITLDTNDVQSNPDIVDHDLGGNLDNIIVKVAGNFKVEYTVQGAPGTGVTTSLQVRKNDTSVIPGSARSGEAAGVTDAPPITGSFVVPLVENDFITLQAKASAGTPNLAAGVVISVVHLAGEKGEKGDASATDVDAVHVNVGNEINIITEKTTPVSDDVLIIEDSGAAGVKKSLKIGNLPGGVSLSDTAPINVTKAAASAGTGTTASRNDHKHDVTTAAPAAGAVVAGGTAAEGASTSLSRADHLHAVSVASPSAVGTANAAGSANTLVRSDHVHAGLTRGAADFDSFTAKGSPVGADLLLIEDSAASNAKKKATVVSLPVAVAGVSNGYLSSADKTKLDTFVGVSPSVVTGTGELTTSATTYTALSTPMSVTPGAGTYLCRFSTSMGNSKNANQTLVSLFGNGVQATESQRRMAGQANNYSGICCEALITVGAGQAIDDRWYADSGSVGSMQNRTLVVQRVS